MRSLRYYTIIFLVFSALLPISLFSQATGELKEDFLYGEYYVMQGMYREALPFYLSVLTGEPDNSNYNYRAGLCYIKLIGEQHNALSYLQKAVLEISSNYVEGKYGSTGAPAEAWLLLGDAYHRDNELTQASYAYHKYLELTDNSDKDRVNMIMKRIEGLGISFEFQRSEQEARMINLGSIINSRFSDYNPVLSGDQLTLVFTQFWETFDRIMISYRTSQGWSSPTDISESTGAQGNCYTSALSYDGTELYLIMHTEENYDIYVSTLVDGLWQPMKAIEGKINTHQQESSICISSDGETCYFSSNRNGGEGGFDIYSANRLGNSWGNIKNLGKIINTPRDEEGPFITADNQILYFSSNGHATVGNMDIQYSMSDGKGSWELPVNFGTPVNTTNDDLFLVYFQNTKTGYLSRDIPDGYGKNDIYMVQTGEVPVFIWDKNQIDTTILIDTSTTVKIAHGYVFENISAGNNQNQIREMNSSGLVVTGANINGIGALPTERIDTNSNPFSSDGILPNDSLTESSTYDTSIRQNLNEESNTTGVPTNENSSLTSENTDVVAVPGVTISSIGIDIPDVNGDKKITNVSDLDSIAAHKQMLADAFDLNLIENESNLDSLPIYTIQILAMHHPVDPKDLNLVPLVVSFGVDGFHRYTYGEYRGYSYASTFLDEVKKKGYIDAFVRNITSVSNYSKR